MVGPLAYIGGKNRFATRIIAEFPKHTTYVEPFAGGAQVFFHKAPSAVEILNDLDGEIVNFLRVCQHHHDELVRSINYWVVSRKWHQWLVGSSPETLTDIQRAARLLYLQKTSFGGLILRQNFHYSVTQRSNYNPTRIPEIIRRAHERLQRVQLECLPYQDIFKKYDRSTTLFYLDPPYWGRRLYRFNFSERDFQELESRLRGVKGKFVLSLNDVPEVRRLFSNFHIHAIDVSYTAQRSGRRRYGELLISNY